MLLLGRELVPGRVAWNASGFRVAHEVVLAFLPSGRLHGLDGARAQREFVIGNHQAVIHPHNPSKPATGLAGAYR